MKKQAEEECTFKPTISGPNLSIQDPREINTKAIETYLERVCYAKSLKQKKEDHLKQVFPDGAKWRNQVTKPKMPNITDARIAESRRDDNQDL